MRGITSFACGFRFGWILASVMLVGLVSACHKDSPESISVALLPLGKISADDVAKVQHAIERQYRAKVTILPASPLPKEAYTAPRKRWRTEKLRPYIDGRADQRFDRVIGLTSADISTTHRGHQDYGIAGEATLGGRPCVVSTFRLRKIRGGAEQTAIHELGHTLGLGHCPDKHCVMRDGKFGLGALPADGPLFCASCQRKLGAHLRSQGGRP